MTYTLIHCLILTLITGKVLSSCRVRDFKVQENFDIKKYVGVTWYEQKWLPQSYIPNEQLFQDYQHTYYLHPDGTSVTTYITGRDPNTLTKCFYYTQEFKTTDTPGKLLKKAKNDTHPYYVDYWIISTDYISYSVIYGCRKQNADGQCTLQDTWVYSRTPQLPDNKTAIVESTLDALCVNKTALLVTQQDNECPVNKDCAIYSIDKKRMQNFDIQRFVGKWYETSWLPQSYIPADELFQDYQHYYDLNSDGTVLTAFIRGRDPVNLQQCFYYQGQLLPTSDNGKFIYRRKINSTYFQTSDYWIMDTDYVKYAVVYGCSKLNSKGLCTYADSWIWSRYPEVPADKLPVVENLKQNICVNTTIYLTTEQTNECTDIRGCSVASIVQRMVDNFDREKIKGLWYKYSYLSSIPHESFTDYTMELESPVSDSGQTTTTKTRPRYTTRDGTCEYKDHTTRKTDTPGKQNVTYTTSTGTKEVEEYVMDTDYESYFITYSCLNQDMHFKCNKPEVSLWSRSTTIPPEKIADAKLTIIGLCLNYDTFVKVEHLNACQPSRGSHVAGGTLYMLTVVLTILQTLIP